MEQSPAWLRKAVAHLKKRDPVLAGVIAKVGPCRLAVDPGASPFEALAESIAYQQITGKAAAAIVGRMTALYPGNRFPTPEELFETPDEKLRACGFSRTKILALKDLAAKCIEGIVPTYKKMAAMEDEEIIEALVAVRGVGRWTAEMLLIFALGRPDILPVGDFGVRKGFQLAYRKREMPTPKQLLKHGSRWAPYRTAASWYMWRAVDLEKAARKPGRQTSDVRV